MVGLLDRETLDAAPKAAAPDLRAVSAGGRTRVMMWLRQIARFAYDLLTNG